MIAGVDGFGGRWVAVVEDDDGQRETLVHDSLDALIADRQLRHVVIDVPIGLPTFLENSYLLRGAATRSSAIQDHGRLGFSTQCEEGSKIGICRKKSPVLPSGSLEDILVAGGAEIVVANVNGIMTQPPQALRDQG